MEQMLEQMKREDAESAEDKARRRKEDGAKAKAEELDQKTKTAENAALNKRKKAEKKAREREEKEAQQEVARAKEAARKEKKEARRRKRAEEPEWAQPPPDKEDWEIPELTAQEQLERDGNGTKRSPAPFASQGRL